MNEKMFNEFKSIIQSGFNKIGKQHVNYYWNLTFGEYLEEDDLDEVVIALEDENLIA